MLIEGEKCSLLAIRNVAGMSWCRQQGPSATL